MPTTLPHPVSQIVRQLLIDLGLAVAGSWTGNTYSGAAWPAFYDDEPDQPDELVTTYDTQGDDDGRSMIDGELWCHEGFQVRVRSATKATGHAKIDAIRATLAAKSSVYDRAVRIDASNVYLIHAATRIGQILSLGKERPASERHLHTLNCTIKVKKV